MEHDLQLATALEMVRETAGEIRRLEAEGIEALHAKGDKETHRANMMAKCELLADLPEHAEPYLKGDDPATEGVRAGLKDFARRANMALDLESIFFMSSLLYPDDYQEGEPNDLERFLMRFEKG